MTAERQLLTENLNYMFLTKNEKTKLSYNIENDTYVLKDSFGVVLCEMAVERKTIEELQEEEFERFFEYLNS